MQPGSREHARAVLGCCKVAWLWRGVQGALNGVARKLLLGGGLVFAVWLMAGGGAEVLKDEVKRKEAVRRVKGKVGDWLAAWGRWVAWGRHGARWHAGERLQRTAVSSRLLRLRPATTYASNRACSSCTWPVFAFTPPTTTTTHTPHTHAGQRGGGAGGGGGARCGGQGAGGRRCGQEHHQRGGGRDQARRGRRCQQSGQGAGD